MLPFEIVIRRDNSRTEKSVERHGDVEQAVASAKKVMADCDLAFLAEVRCAGRPVWTIGRGWSSHTCLDTSTCGQACPNRIAERR